MKSEDSAEWVLGGIINNPENFERAKRRLMKEDFLNPIHQEIFKAMEDLFSDDVPIEASTLYPLLKEKSIELAKYLEEVPTDAGFDYHVKEVKRQSIEAQLRQATSGESINAVKIEVLSFELATLKKGEPIGRSLSEIPRRENVPIIETGFKILDPKIKFGKRRKLIVAGRTSEGKTSFGVQASCYIARQMPVAIVTLEMSEEDLRDRIYNSFGVLSGMVDRNLKIVHPQQVISSLDLKYILKTLKADYKTQVFFLDYLQKMEENRDSRGRNFQNRHLEVSFSIGRVAAIADELDMGAIIVSTIKRGANDKAEPCLSDLKESGDVEYESDVVLFVHTPDKSKDTKLLITAKNRFGPCGDCEIRFNKTRTKFEEIEEPLGDEDGSY